jgi:hypothetical protein
VAELRLLNPEHYNLEWTNDPNLAQQSTPGPKSYAAVHSAHLTTVGAELTLSTPYAGRLWISPSYLHIRNGWALANGGTEVMHSLGGAGVATNYLAWTGSPSDSTGSGSIFNLGFLYGNTLSGIQGHTSGSLLPEVTLNTFGLLQALDWLSFLLCYDSVNYDAVPWLRPRGEAVHAIIEM